VAAIVAERAQLWAEARGIFLLDGIAWEDAERLGRGQHDQHRITDAWEEPIREWLEAQHAEFYRLNDVIQFALNMDVKQIARREELRVGRILQVLGFEKSQRTVEGTRKKVWVKKCPF